MTQLAVDRPAPERQALWRDFDRCYRAVTARDARFDGQFITAVRTTGIYCRPSCPALTPLARNVEFHPTAAAAQAAGFRACRRCLPDAVPGSPEWNLRADLAARAMRLIADGIVEREGVSGLASRLGYSERQLGRVLTTELGAGPLALARAHRAHAARLLIEVSPLSFSDIAFAAGFSSVRQFNATVREVFAITPSRMRETALRREGSALDTGAENSGPSKSLRLSLRLPFRRPFDAAGVLAFLSDRAIDGVETWSEDGYARTLRLPLGSGVVRVQAADDHIRCSLRLSEVGDVSSAVARVRRMLDLDADPIAVDDVLGADQLLAPGVAAVPGIRVPGAADAHELVIRAMLGQQVTVAAARTAAGKLVAALGEPLPDTRSGAGPAMLFPTAKAIAEHGAEILRGPARRISSIVGVAGALASGELDLHVGRDSDELRADLLAQPGIGPWTADYVQMRVLGSPDVLLTGDVGLRNGARAIGFPHDPAGLAERMQALRPWRSYAGMHLWRSAPKQNGEAL